MFTYEEMNNWPLLDAELVVSCKKKYWIFGYEPIGWGPYYRGIPGYLYHGSEIYNLGDSRLTPTINLKCYI